MGADNDGQYRCMHGNKASLIKRPDIGPGWVEKVPGDCKLCAADPEFSKSIPYQPGNWQEIAAKEAADAADAAEAAREST